MEGEEDPGGSVDASINGQINYHGPSTSKGRPRAGRRARNQKYTEGVFPEVLLGE